MAKAKKEPQHAIAIVFTVTIAISITITMAITIFIINLNKHYENNEFSQCIWANFGPFLTPSCGLQCAKVFNMGHNTKFHNFSAE